jgi:membrane protein
MSSRSGRPGPVVQLGDFKEAFTRFQKDEMSQRAAALTYYALMSLFPALLIGVAAGAFGSVLLFLGGGLAEDVLGEVGLGESAVDVWGIVRWPGALFVAMLVYAVVYYAAPNVEIRNWRYITPGAVFGVLAWLIASAAFFFYVSSFAGYSATYGAFATVVILLIWLYLTSAVLLLGAELNAVVDLRRSRHLPRNYDGPMLPPKEPAEA